MGADAGAGWGPEGGGRGQLQMAAAQNKRRRVRGKEDRETEDLLLLKWGDKTRCLPGTWWRLAQKQPCYPENIPLPQTQMVSWVGPSTGELLGFEVGCWHFHSWGALGMLLWLSVFPSLGNAGSNGPYLTGLLRRMKWEMLGAVPSTTRELTVVMVISL